jgi:DNA-binding CsgD family transcriptional regulator
MPWLDGLLEGFAELPGDTLTERLALTQAALSAAYDPTASADRVAALARRALGDGALLSGVSVDRVAVGMAAYALVMSDQLDEASVEVERMRADARDRGSALGYSGVGLLAGQIELARGMLDQAAAEFESVLGTARGLGDSPVTQRCIGFANAWLIESLLAAGRTDEARTAVAHATDMGEFDRPELVWSRYGRGLLRLLAQRDVAGACEDLLAVGAAAAAGCYEDRHAPWRQWAARALSASGRAGEAIALADEQLRIAAAWSPGRHGAALCTRAMVGDPGDAEAMFASAVELLAASPLRLERARALVEHAAALRRAGQARAARSRFVEGMDLAARCGAAPLAELARAELIILGARPRRMMFSGVEGLTATEHRVAAMAAEGLTNREIAQALFVTLKTVEVHLSHTYRKLGISSRAQLRAALNPAADTESALR